MSQQENLALETVAPDEGLSASSSPNPGQVTQTIKRALATGHYMGAATSCSTLPHGCEVAFSAVKIDPTRETYPLPVGSKRGIGKTALNRIAKAIGVDWDTRLSHRTDDGKDSCFASFKAVGHYRDFDGTWRTIEGEKQMDLRDGSERARTMKAGELSETRKFIAEHAETKAKLRAIRSIGIETSYDPGFYDDPIICARLIFTGRSDNPEIQARFADMIAAAMLGNTNLLYGEAPRALPTQLAESERQTESSDDARPTTEPEVKTCSPDECFGRGSNHVKACALPVNKSGPEQQSSTAGQPDNAWVIPGKGSARGLRITDPKVTPDTLFALRKEYAEALNPEGDLRGKLNDEAVDFYAGALREVQKEIDRRGICTDDKKY